MIVTFIILQMVAMRILRRSFISEINLTRQLLVRNLDVIEEEIVRRRVKLVCLMHGE